MQVHLSHGEVEEYRAMDANGARFRTKLTRQLTAAALEKGRKHVRLFDAAGKPLTGWEIGTGAGSAR